MMRVDCKVTDCGWDTRGTEAGAGPAICVRSDDVRPECLMRVNADATDDECGHELDEALAVYAGQTTEEEWRVTGDPGPGYPPYSYTWTGDNAEKQARGFTRLCLDFHGNRVEWRDGPHLHHRTVTRTPWQEATPTTPTKASDQ